ncbi:MAG: hypothetical protein JSW52_11725 [Candidatus Coatesbacteria bacterium]|nr:MAG: hypothetical protein JSW52_11725 [Candidatus Coatesbacteria bacterium]
MTEKGKGRFSDDKKSNAKEKVGERLATVLDIFTGFPVISGLLSFGGILVFFGFFGYITYYGEFAALGIHISLLEFSPESAVIATASFFAFIAMSVLFFIELLLVKPLVMFVVLVCCFFVFLAVLARALREKLPWLHYAVFGFDFFAVISFFVMLFTATNVIFTQAGDPDFLRRFTYDETSLLYGCGLAVLGFFALVDAGYIALVVQSFRSKRLKKLNRFVGIIYIFIAILATVIIPRMNGILSAYHMDYPEVELDDEPVRYLLLHESEDRLFLFNEETENVEIRKYKDIDYVEILGKKTIAECLAADTG